VARDWQHLTRPKNGIYSKATGFSLMEVLISLSIISIMMMFIVSMPLKTVEKMGELQDTSTAIQETQHIFVSNFKREFGLSKHLLPIFINTNDQNEIAFDGRKQLFLAYFDSKRQKNIRVGYLIQKDTHNPYHFQLLRAEISDTSELSNYQSANPDMSMWQHVGVTDKKNSLMLETSNSNAPVYFQYCVGNDCNDNVTPKQATGVKIVAKAAGQQNYETIRVVLNKSSVNIPSLYFRLGSLLTEENASVGMYAFPAELDRQAYSRIGFRDNAATGGRRIIGPSTSTGSDIQITDPSFNSKTGNYTAVGQSITGDKTFYILRWSKRSQNYPGYEATASSTGILNPEGISQSPFPVAIGPWTPAYPGAPFNFVSATEDDDGYIYVLANNAGAPNFEARIYRYSPSGNYISYSNITSTTNPINGAYGIAYSASTPKEVHVLVSALDSGGSNNNNYFIRTYDKLDNHTNAAQVSHTAESPQLNVARISGSFFTGVTPTGLDIIPEKNHYILSGITTGSSALCRFVSFPINLPAEASDEQFGSPFSRGFMASTVNSVQGGAATPLSNCRGVAVDPSIEMLTTPLDNPNGRALSYLGLNASLNRSFQ
jgi:prepilin-type N-terminal cleavage/methylation domain-containing protein